MLVFYSHDVCDTAKVRFFKQITTKRSTFFLRRLMFVILQKYDFSSKSQLPALIAAGASRCLWYCKSTIFQANHNLELRLPARCLDVCDTAKVRFFKQITTGSSSCSINIRCLWYCKSTIFQANHNSCWTTSKRTKDVCDTAKVRFFKQITTNLS